MARRGRAFTGGRRAAGRVVRPGPAGTERPHGLPGALLERRLAALVRQRIAVRVTDNVHTMISFGGLAGALEVRVHHMFLRAPAGVIQALARYIDGGSPEASLCLDGFIARHRRRIRRIPARVRQARLQLREQGSHHDLGKIQAALARRFFGGPLGCAITWGTPAPPQGPRRSIKLGSYSEDARLIRIHPALDQEGVPRFFVEWIVFHEMLHRVHRAVIRGGRRLVHTAEFRAHERTFPGYERARAWEGEHIEWLLRWRPAAQGLHLSRPSAAACRRGAEAATVP